MQLKQFNFSKEKFSKQHRDQIDGIHDNEDYNEDFEGEEQVASRELERQPYSIESFTNGLTGGSNVLSSPETFNQRDNYTNNNSGYLEAKKGESQNNLHMKDV